MSSLDNVFLGPTEPTVTSIPSRGFVKAVRLAASWGMIRLDSVWAVEEAQKAQVPTQQHDS